MIKLLLASLFALSYPPGFKWKAVRDNPYFSIQSLYNTNEKQERYLIDQYKKAHDLFFGSFENINPELCYFERLNVRIVSPRIINNKRLFRDAISNSEVFGRYFWRKNLLYITSEVFSNPEYLAHELAHYFYDECGLWRGRLEEERRAYRFQELF